MTDSVVPHAWCETIAIEIVATELASEPRAVGTQSRVQLLKHRRQTLGIKSSERGFAVPLI